MIKNIKKQKQSSLISFFRKNDQVFLEDVIPQISFFEYIKYWGAERSLKKIAQNILKRQYGLNCVIFWSNYSEKAIWIQLLYYLIK